MSASRMAVPHGGVTVPDSGATLAEITDQRQWDELIEQSPNGHPLQLWAWGEVKRPNGWTPYRLALRSDGAIAGIGQMLFWRIPGWGRTLAYLPRGPVGAVADAPEYVRYAAAFARAHGALFLRIEPAWTSMHLPGGWVCSDDSILLRQTYTVDLTKDPDALWASLRGKTRQYVRKAESEGVSIERDLTGARLPDVWRIYQDTAARAGFDLHTFDYYRNVFHLYGVRTALYIAIIDGRPEAFLWLVEGAGVAFEFYGGMTAAGGARKANYALKWHALSAMQQAGCRLYDFNGRLNDGVNQFKSGFGADETDYAGTYELPLRPLSYVAWQRLWPLVKPLGRSLLRRRAG